MGQDNLEQLITKMWKTLDRKARILNVKRMSKLVNEGIALNEKLISRETQSSQQQPNTSSLQPHTITDFDILTGLYNRTPVEDLAKKLTPNSVIQ
jgi:hypothetical protein